MSRFKEAQRVRVCARMCKFVKIMDIRMNPALLHSGKQVNT